jgi:putative ABC transport system permease protein
VFDLFKLAMRNVFRHRGRTLMTLASIVFGVTALILAGGFIEDTIVETGESMIRSSTGHLQVARQGYWQYGTRNPEKYLMENPENLRRELAAAPGVEDVMLRIGFSGLLGNGRTDWPIIGEGVEPAREKRLASYITVVAGRRLMDGDAFGMMIGQGVAKALKLKPGDPVTLLVSTAGGATNLLEFQVTGVFQTFSKDYDARAVRIPWLQLRSY